MEILKSKGISFDESYCDDNSKKSMPDLKYANGGYLEITHTHHNNSIVNHQNNYSKKSTAEQLKILENASEAYLRLMKRNYPKIDCNTLTDEEKKQFEKDKKILKKHFGYDVSNCSQRFCEFNCDSPIIECSSDNILIEITDDKGKKHSDGNTDLFIFVLEDEMESVKYLLKTSECNGSRNEFLNTILSSFKVVYLCVWNFENQTYNIDNPVLMKFETIGKTLKIEFV